MKKTLLQEVKAMNKIAGTQMTKQQEIKLIRERLEQLNELEFGTQKAFDSYQKNHDLRDTTKVTVAGKKMSVSQAKDQSKDPAVKQGSAVFGKGKGGEVFGSKAQKPASDHKGMVKNILKNTEFDEAGAYKLSDSWVTNPIMDGLKSGTSKVNKELADKLNNKEKGTYIQTHEIGGNILFNNGDHYVINSGEGGEIDAIKLSDIKGPKPTDEGWDTDSVYSATFEDPETGETISVEDAYNGDEDTEAYSKADEYISLFNPDDEKMGMS
jgi:hypothetical protein